LTNGLLPINPSAMAEPNLIAEVDAFLARKDVQMTASTFGRLAANDGKLVDRLKSGGRVWPETAEKIRSFMRNHGKSRRARQPARAGAA